MTNNPLSKSIYLDTSRETVWAFLTESDKLAQWFHATEADLAVGEDYALLEKQDDGSNKKVCWGTVLEAEKPSRLVYTFTFGPLAGAMTTVTWTLEEAFGGTKLSLLHEGIDEAAGEAVKGMLFALDAGWDKHLAKLRTAI